MDPFFGEELQSDVFFWYEVSSLSQSAFVPYTPNRQIGINNSTANMNKRMIELLKNIHRRKMLSPESQKSEGNRSYRRRMSERLRRENEKKGYSALHSMLPRGTKNDKKSIMQMAARRLEELKGYKEELERRNHELEVKLEEMGTTSDVVGKSSKIEFRVTNPISDVEYIVEVLKCLNGLGVKITSIQSSFSDHQLVAVIHIQTQIADAEVREAVGKTLQDVEWKLQFNFPEHFVT